MANLFKPSVQYKNRNGESVSHTLPTYEEVKRKMNHFMDDSINNNISVYRSRRGQWGEWWEHWCSVKGKPTIVNQGWQ